MARKMKDSGIEWIGEIPEVWEIVGVKDAFVRKNTKANKKNPTVLSLARDGIKIRDISNNEGQLASDYTNYNPVCVDDLLLNPMDLISGDNCNISKVDGVISPAYINLRYKKHTNPKLYNYYFKYLYWYKVFFAHGKGVSYENRWTLNFETLRKIPLPLPSKEEQDKIANFLDEKTSEIDGIKKDIEKEIEVLEDYKKSIIYEAVTKGLDKNAEMKDSGVEWIGKIPKYWGKSTIKRYCSIKTGGTPSTTNEEWFNGELRWYTPVDFTNNYVLEDSKRTLSIQAKTDNVATLVPKDTVLIIGIGATIGRIGFTTTESSFNQQITALQTEDLDSKYLMYWMIASQEYIMSTISFTTLPILNNEKLGQHTLIYPESKKIQKTIVQFLDQKTSEIDSIISDKREQVQVLEEYKKSMIYEYVTGKKAVE